MLEARNKILVAVRVIVAALLVTIQSCALRVDLYEKDMHQT